MLTDIANELRDRGALVDEEECFIDDATFVMAKGGGAEIGPTKRGRRHENHGDSGSRTDCHPRSARTPRTITMFVWCSSRFDFYMIEAKPQNLIGDRAYDSDPLDEELRRDGIEMIAPHRSNRTSSRRRKIDDG